MSQPAAMPNPEKIFHTMTAYQETAVLKTALELGVFSLIAAGSDTVGAIAEKTKCAQRGIRILCDRLAVLGFATKTGIGADARYALAPDAAMFLDRKSPAYIGDAAIFLTGEMVTGAYTKLTDAVRKGGTALDEQGSMKPDHPAWVDFARGMMPLMMPAAEAIAEMLEPRLSMAQGGSVLDIAAGHGIFGIMVAKRYPSVRIVAVDWPRVLEVAQENAKKFGIGYRHSLLPGSAFDVDFGGNHDAVLLTNFLHHFDPATNEKLLKKVHAALRPGGWAVVLEFVPNDDRITPPDAAAFSTVMLASTAQGDAYTFAEYQQMFRNAGFAASEHHRLPAGFSSVLIAKKG
jgi:cyclopropane fatty-acyl-phospholipid synthase-like methyltransferase